MSSKGCFIRIGSASEPMPDRMIEELFAKRTRNSIGKIESRRQDLTFEQLKIYYQAKGFSLNSKFANNLELLAQSNKYNYAAYLLADENGNSVKVAKYLGENRVDLVENNEFGYCSLIKATKLVLDKLEVENKTFTKITSKERLEKRMLDPIAMREATINAMVHNNYTNEVPPKFEFFSDRLEITSAGGLPIGFNEKEFFEGYSFPQNKELMRIFKDLELVEYLGSGIPRILQKYTENAFKITDNFIRIILPYDIDYFNRNEEQTIENLGKTSIKIIELIRQNSEITIAEISIKLNIGHKGVEWQLSKLKNKNIIKHEGSRKKGKWIVLEKN